ncbi:MAG: hypothetical protein QOH93_724 [Chloroflexia bacterium]|jgi:hypothetical protein|nr:hypothetical protein [Chloroflexia bacterium]
MPRYYTLSEANGMLPQLSQLLELMQAQRRQLELLQGRSSVVAQKTRGNGNHNPSEDVALVQATTQVEEALEVAIKQLQGWGIELKDLETGLVDFPALREGRTVYLCWKLGEPEIAFWHETDSGFAGRQPLDEEFS